MRHSFRSLLVLCVLLPGVALAAGGTIYRVDPDHPTVAVALEAAGQAVLWSGPGTVLTFQGDLPDARPVLSLSGREELFLARIAAPEVRGLLAERGRIAELEPELFLVAVEPGALDDMAHPALWRKRLSRLHAWKPARGAPEEARDLEYSPHIQAFVDAVSQLDLVMDVTALQDFNTRYSYAQGCVDSGNWLENQFEALGLTVTREQHTSGMAPNVIAELPGTVSPDEIVIICGHYDSISDQPNTLAPGADDNGTGTAAALQAAKVMVGNQFERTIRFIGFSGEEQGLYGSDVSAGNSASAGEDIVGVINLDMIGYVDQAPEDLSVIGDASSAWLVDLFIEAAGLYTTLPTERVINAAFYYSDHSSYWDEGYSALCGIEDHTLPLPNPHYHTTHDTVDTIDQAFFTTSVKASVAATAHLAVPMPAEVYVQRHELDDQAGDGDGYLDPAETVGIKLWVKNNLDISAGPIQFTLSCTQGGQYVDLLDSEAEITVIPAGQTGDTCADPFRIYIHPDVPDFTELSFQVDIVCPQPHSASYPFSATATSYTYDPEVHRWLMEEDPGWTVSGGVWAWGQPTGQGGDHGNPDPSSGHTGANVLGTVLTGDYPADADATVTSGPFDCSEVAETELRLWRWLNVEQPTYDQARIWVDGGSGFQQVWVNGSEITDSAWTEMVVDISAQADGQSAVRLRFGIETDSGWEYSGWNLDDLRIAGLAPGDPLPTPTVGPPTATPTLAPTPGTPTPTAEPTEPNPTATPEPTHIPGEPWYELDMPDLDLAAGETFLLERRCGNPGVDDLPVHEYILLDVDDQYWFWPGWTQEVDRRSWLLEAGSEEEEAILTFPWPTGAGSLTGVRFWGGLVDPATVTLIELDHVEWSFH